MGDAEMVTEENNTGRFVDSDTGQMIRIVRDHKVFWTTVPIELAGGEGVVRVGMSLVLVGTDADETVSGDDGEKHVVFNKLQGLAEWLVPKDEPNVEFEIRRNENITFYLPDDLRTKRKNYVVGIRILHSEGFNTPMDKYQTQVLKQLESKLKELECPKDHWKKQPVNQI
jgi:hypothetical protein